MYEEELDVDFDIGASEEHDLQLDAEVFNPVDYINRQFPNEASLCGLDDFVDKLKAQQRKIDEDIRLAVRRQAACGRRARADLEEAKAAVRELFDRIKAIQGKAEQSEALVSDVCRDIKSLDVAKRNLTLTVTALKRLVMLVTALDQLKSLTKARRYKEGAGLICAVNELAAHFQELQHVSRVADLLESKAKILRELRTQILEDYASLNGPEHEHQAGVEDASACVDAMGPSVRRDVITQFCLRLLEDYKDLFEPPKPYAGLENAERRYTWLKNKLRDYKTKYASHFPEHWRVPCGLCEHFCHVTRQHLVEVLSTSHHTVDPELMVRALKKSIEFENELARRYPAEEEELVSLECAPKGVAELVAASGVQFKYPDVIAEEKKSGPAPPSAKLGGVAATANRLSAASAERERERAAAQSAPRFVGTISVCFDAYLTSWVQHEEKALLEAMDKKVASDNKVGQDDHDEEGDGSGTEPRIWFESAPDLFANMKSSCTDCVGFSTHQTLYDMFQAFRKVIAVYVSRLEGLLPKKVTQPLDANAVQTICCVIGTAEYCDEMTSQFEELLTKVIDKSFVDRVSFSHEQDLFRNLHSRANMVLVSSVSSSLDEAFGKMTRTNWQGFNQEVGDNSPYVGDISERLSGQFEPIAKYLSKIHYRFFCDKFVQAFVARFISEIYRCRKISEQGAQQLLLDTSFIKTTLLEAPVTAQGSGKQMQTAYSNYVLKEMDRAGTMLKVLASPEIDAAAVSAMLGKGWAREDVERLLALRVGYDGEASGGIAGLAARIDEERRFDASEGVAALRSTFTSFGDSFNQKSTKLSSDMKKKFSLLPGVNLPGLGAGRSSK